MPTDLSLLPARERVCCFTGHRDMTMEQMQAVLPRLTDAVTALLERGVTTFIVGGARGFDTLAAIQLINLRRHLYPNLRLVLARPCPDQASRWVESERTLYETIRANADLDILLSDHYYNGCMHNRNAFMVDHSSHVLAYVTRNSGGSYYTVNLARKQGVTVQNLADCEHSLYFPDQQGLFDGI